jgi:hypothetical protein
VTFSKILVANRGDNGRKAAVAAKPDCLLRAAQPGDLAATEAAIV